MKISKPITLLIVFIGFVVLIACEKLLPSAPEPEEVLAEPVGGLTPSQMASHIAGDEAFAHVFSKEEGLGPLFVANSCESCHVGDGKGHPLTMLTRFGRSTGSGFDPMIDQGGPQLQHRSIAGYLEEVIPSGATGVTSFIAPMVTGLGYLEAVHDTTILAWADSLDMDADGISGRVNYVEPPDFFVPKPHHVVKNVGGTDLYIGRFGRKASAIDLIIQTVTAYKQDMGITSDFDTEDLYNVQVGNFTGDEVPDPEISAATVNNNVFYLRTLKVPPRRNTDDPDVQQGELLFTTIGCADCHRPTMKTGPSDVAALSNKTFYPYSDMLLHDMGSGLDDGYTENDATSSEWRTTPLWGLGLSKDSQGNEYHLLHDGRAKTLEQAIGYHGGEAATSRANYNALSQSQKTQLIKFLESL